MVPMQATKISPVTVKALILSQINPVKTMKQLATDRGFYRTFIVAALLLAFCC